MCVYLSTILLTFRTLILFILSLSQNDNGTHKVRDSVFLYFLFISSLFPLHGHFLHSTNVSKSSVLNYCALKSKTSYFPFSVPPNSPTSTGNPLYYLIDTHRSWKGWGWEHIFLYHVTAIDQSVFSIDQSIQGIAVTWY